VRRLADVPGEGEARIRAATEQMAADLGDLLVEGDTHEERLRVARVAELLANEEPDRTLERWNGLGRQVELAGRALRGTDPELIARVTARVDAYYAELERLGLTDEQLAPGTTAPAREPAPEPAWVRIALAPLAASGFALYALPYFLPRWLARRADADAVSTFKLGAALIVYPLWMGGLVAGALVLLPAPLSLAAAAVAIASPFAALRWLDAWYRRGGRATPAELAQLAALRLAARAAIDEARVRLPS
jgi:hypothetical protein